MPMKSNHCSGIKAEPSGHGLHSEACCQEDFVSLGSQLASGFSAASGFGCKEVGDFLSAICACEQKSCFFFPHRFSKGTGVLCIYTHTHPNNYLAMEMGTLCPYFAFEN